MKAVKQLFVLLLLVLFAVAMIACNGNESEGTSVNDQSNNNEVETEEQAPPVEDVSINVLTQSMEPQDLLDKFRDEYPHITVNWEQVDSANITQVIRTRIAAGGENLDIVTPQRADYIPLVEAGAFFDLSNETFLTNYDPSAVDSATVDGDTYGIPLTQQTYLIWYNKDVFNEQGLEVPTDWEEFLAVSEILKSNGIAPLVVPGQDDWILNVFGGFAYSGLLSQEPNWYDKAQEGEVKWTDDASVEALYKISTLMDNGYILSGALGTGYDQAYQAFYQGEAAMFVNGAWSVDLIIDTPPSFEVGAFVPPGNAPGEQLKVAFTPGNIISVASASQNTEAALTFLKFLSEPENALLFTDEIKQFSSVIGASADFHEATQIIQPTFEYEKTQMMHAEVSQNVASALGPALQKLIAGEATPEEVAEEIQTAQDRDVE